MPAQTIRISGARQHNLKNLHVEIPREKFVVITGLSASGKSSLTFDTLYAKGARLLPDRTGNSKRSHGIHPTIRKNRSYDVQGQTARALLQEWREDLLHRTAGRVYAPFQNDYQLLALLEERLPSGQSADHWRSLAESCRSESPAARDVPRHLEKATRAVIFP